MKTPQELWVEAISIPSKHSMTKQAMLSLESYFYMGMAKGCQEVGHTEMERLAKVAMRDAAIELAKMQINTMNKN